MTNYSFNIQLAQDYGVDEAIMLENIYFWVEKNKANNKHFHNGYYWTYNSTKAMTSLFPFWSEDKIKRIIKKLKDYGLVITENFNELKYDRTLWYAMTEKSIVYFEKIHCADSHDPLCKNAQPIPDINTDLKEKEIYKEKETHDEECGLFWNLYPRKVNKKKALEKLQTLLRGKIDINTILAGVKKYNEYIQANRVEEKFIKHPLTWLNGNCWEDYSEETPQQADSGFKIPEYISLVENEDDLFAPWWYDKTLHKFICKARISKGKTQNEDWTKYNSLTGEFE